MSTLAAGFPNVSVIDGREMLTALKAVVDNVTLAVTVVGTLVVVSGLLILVGAVAMTKFRRVYEAAILKTLGATRRVIGSMLLLEYGVLGALAGVLGRRRGRRPDLGPQPVRLRDPVAAAAGAARLRRRRLAATVVSAVGLAASWDVLRKKPLATLRGQ